VTGRWPRTHAMRPVSGSRGGAARVGDQTQVSCGDQTHRGCIRSSADVRWHQLASTQRRTLSGPNAGARQVTLVLMHPVTFSTLWIVFGIKRTRLGSASGGVKSAFGQSLTVRSWEFDHWDRAIVVESRGHVDGDGGPDAGGVRPVIPHLRVRSTRENRQ
jgi:hypothetical protein